MQVWVMAARPRTLLASMAPVIAGTAIAWRAGALRPAAALLALLSSVFIQIGTNFANDYSDFRRGADAERVGPRRVTQDEIRTSFADGWAVDAIDAVRMPITILPDGIYAWRASIMRT